MNSVKGISEPPNQNGGVNEISSYLRLRPMNKYELSKRSKHSIDISQNKDVRVDSKLDGTCSFNFNEVGHLSLSLILILTCNDFSDVVKTLLGIPGGLMSSSCLPKDSVSPRFSSHERF